MGVLTVRFVSQSFGHISPGSLCKFRAARKIVSIYWMYQSFLCHSDPLENPYMDTLLAASSAQGPWGAGWMERAKRV